MTQEHSHAALLFFWCAGAVACRASREGPFPRFLFLGPKATPAAPELVHRRDSVCVCVCVCVCACEMLAKGLLISREIKRRGRQMRKPKSSLTSAHGSRAEPRPLTPGRPLKVLRSSTHVACHLNASISLHRQPGMLATPVSPWNTRLVSTRTAQPLGRLAGTCSQPPGAPRVG